MYRLKVGGIKGNAFSEQLKLPLAKVGKDAGRAGQGRESKPYLRMLGCLR